MAIKPLKVTFTTDGSGVYYDPNEPLMLDGLLGWCLAPLHCDSTFPPSRDETPVDIPLPLGRWHLDGQWGWCASALFPEGDAEFVTWVRKRFRVNRAELVQGNPNLSGSVYHDRNLPFAMNLATRWVGWALGDRKRVEQLLRKNIRYLGKKRAAGHGRVVDVKVEWCEQDLSVLRDGRAQRYLPKKDGLRVVRPRPPYWNIVGAIPCCEIGEEIAFPNG